MFERNIREKKKNERKKETDIERTETTINFHRWCESFEPSHVTVLNYHSVEL